MSRRCQNPEEENNSGIKTEGGRIYPIYLPEIKKYKKNKILVDFLINRW